jgi:hypothetical protein
MKNDNKFKITKAELQQIIKEEYASMAQDAKRANEIKARLEAINEELSGLPETLSEVEAGGLKSVKSTGWTGAGEADKKYDEKFEKIGSHLKEDEEVEGEMELGGEEMEAPEMGYFEMKFAELGRELDAKMGGEGEEEMEDMEDVEVIDMGSEDEEGEEEIEEYAEMQPDGEHGNVQQVNEDLEEPIEGETPAQDSEARFNDYMEKDKHVNEGVKKGTTLLSEGKTPAQKSALDRELERMKALAKLNK